MTVDLGTGDGRAVLARASAHPAELVVGIDASSAVMVRASRRAAAPIARGGLPNARFVLAGLEGLPAELREFADRITIHFPWGSLLAAAVGDAPAMTARIVRPLRSGGTLVVIVSASPRDASRGLPSLDPEATAMIYRQLGLRIVASRAATPDDLATARSSWGRRLASSPARSAWLTELQRPTRAADARPVPAPRVSSAAPHLFLPKVTDASDCRRE
ncbi:MAG: class I SAM-dependent methyltransferase [Chloroflexota bacterium]|nr:class I SAM-dependent methyltransferase [Chloroflexota bacterium]